MDEPNNGLLPSMSNKRPGITAVTIVTARNGMRAVVLTHASGARAELYLYGAHLTSWRSADGDELLFLSEQAVFEAGAGIRGGVPVIFPQFGPGPLPQHGFARKREWTVEDHGADGQGAAFVRLSLRDTLETRALWPHSFLAELTVRLDTALEVELRVINTGDQPWEFTAALHSYFRVRHIRDVRIHGLAGLRYRDKVQDGAERVDQDDTVTISEVTDRVYLDTPPVLRIDGAGEGRTLRLEKQGFADAVVWNPWAAWARELEHFGDQEYLEMVCVEAAQVGEPIRLARGGQWSGRQVLLLDEFADA
jgi:glucose-6-phosphate 1-epimerase